MVRAAGVLAVLLVAIAARPARAQCADAERDARGNCPDKPPPHRPPPHRPPRPHPHREPARIHISGDDVAGARVSLDGRPVGKVPVTLATTPGRHRIELRLAGHAPFSTSLELTAGRTVELVVPALPTVAATPPAAPAPRARAGRCPAGMVHIPGGSFRMGSPDGVGDKDEHPQHRVTLSGYCIDKTEVTVAAYARCAAAGACAAAQTPTASGAGSLCNGDRADRRNHPVNCVDWNQATAYCGWAHKRLPTEAEWEYAARGGDGRTYPWGNEAPSPRRLNACGATCVALVKRVLGSDWKAMYDASDGWDATAPVGSFPAGASPFGVLDMAGNVWEWTADRYGAYPASASTNPSGPNEGDSRVYRGGGWLDDDAGLVRAAFRYGGVPGLRHYNLGFRCARGD